MIICQKVCQQFLAVFLSLFKMEKEGEQPQNLPLPPPQYDPNINLATVAQLHEYMANYQTFDGMNQNQGNAAPTNKNTRKHKFTPEEDETLKRLVQQYGYDWKVIAAILKNRNARQCRDRWKNYLRPEVNLRQWSPEEDALLIQKYQEYGRQWSIIAKSFPDRTDIHIKNRWATIASKFPYQAQQDQIPATMDPNLQIPE